MEIISTVALISINETLLVQLVSFLLFLFLINRVMFRPLRKSMRERDSHMNSLEEEIRAAGETIQSIQEQIRQEEAATTSKAGQLQRHIEEEAGRDVNRIRQTGIETVTRLRQAASGDLDRLISDARSHLERESETIARQLMATLLEREVER